MLDPTAPPSGGASPRGSARLARRLLTAALLALVVACGSKPTTTTTVDPPPGDGSGQVTTTIDAVPPQGSDAILPLWPAIKHGTLPNGMQYYVMKNAKPEKRAVMWMALKAGSVQEDDDQRGLAHFVEHMAFNGTKRFPEADIVHYLESIGLDFGADLNAHTWFDETVYKLTVPSDNKQFLDKGFEILRDWAADISFDAKEVEKERGVVLEEWRLGRGAFERMNQKQLPVVLGGTRYAVRDTIGLPEIITKAPRERLVQYYKDWYRPELMAVFVVGDFADEAAIEAQVKTVFGDLKNPEKPRARPTGGVPEAKGTQVSLIQDKEMPLTLVQVQNVFAHRPEASGKDYRRYLAETLYAQIINERFDSLSRKPEAAYQGASVGVSEYPGTRDVDLFQRFAAAKPGKAEDALRQLLTEVARVEQHGVTQAELDRARTNLLRGLDQNAVASTTRESQDIVDEMTRNFLQNEFMVGGVAEKELAEKFLPTFTVAELNKLGSSFGGAENRVISIVGPEGQPQPTKERVLQIVDEVAKSKIDAWQEKAAATSLMAQKPTPGSVKSEKKNDQLSTVEWKLSNGVTVVVKATDFEADSVQIAGDSIGGLTVATAKQFPDARFADELAAIGGAGELSDEDLRKALAGKSVSVQTGIGETNEYVTANGSVRDIETMLQLIYLKMAAPRKDADLFKVWQANTAAGLEEQLRDPSTQFRQKSTDVLYKGNVRRKMPTAADVKKVDLDKALAFYSDRFGDATDFTFVIVGAVDVAKLKPLVEQYLGALPAKGRIEKEKDPKTTRVTGVVKKSWNFGTEPRAQVQLMFHGAEKWTRDTERDLDILSNVLGKRLRETMREDLGGVYGVGAYGWLTRIGKTERSFVVSFGCDPDRVDELVKAVQTVTATLAKEGPTEAELAAAKETYLRDRERGMKTNGFWVNWLSDTYHFGDDPNLILDTGPRLARYTADNVKSAAKKFVSTKQYYQAVMLPIAGTKPEASPGVQPPKQ